MTHTTEGDIMHGLILSLGRSEYAVAELKQLTAAFGISESSLRTWLSRQLKRGFLTVRREGRASFYALADKARRISANVSQSFGANDWSDWDGTWWGFVFSVPENRRADRHRVRTKLSAYRFAPWYGGFWIRPRHPREPIAERFGDDPSGRTGRLLAFTSVVELGGDEVRRLWNVPEVQAESRSALEVIAAERSRVAALSPEEAHVRRIEVGNAVVPVIFKDPLLPPRYLPEGWAGDRLKAEFAAWDHAVAERARPFWRAVFGVGA
ncbi:MAG: PaaX family transcriptional regulator C-terminal domain-containing protein [Spirochaetota bacterium]